jgi:hypothetical protein
MTRTLLLAAAALAAAAPALAPMSAMAEDGGRKFTIAMTGEEEEPGPGDDDGTGTAALRVNPGQGQVCYDVTYANIDPPTAAHIHRAPAGSPGPVVVPLRVAADGTIAGCATVTRALALELIRTPEEFYVNVHNQPFPLGAIRGQLAK